MPPLPFAPPTESPAVPPPPEAGADDEAAAADAAASGGVSMGLALAFLVVGLILGFFIGARSRQIVAKIKNVGKAMVSLSSLFKSAEAGGLDSAEAMKDGEDDEKETEEEGKEAELKDFLDEFLQLEETPGLDDHVDLEINPVIMHNIKKAKEAQRIQQQRAALAAEGLTEDEIETRLNDGDAPKIGGGKPKALSFLISLGARVEASRGAASEEAKKKEEMRRKQRNIKVFLSQTLNVDTATKAAGESAKGGRLKNALEVAKDTKLHPVGGTTMRRSLAAKTQAKSARNVYRANKTKVDEQLAAASPEGERRLATKKSATEIAEQLAEEEPEEAEDGAEGEEGADEEGEEGEEGDGEEDGEQLTA